MNHPDPDLNDPAALQRIVDFMHWFTTAAKLPAYGIRVNVPEFTGDSAKMREIARLAKLHGITPQRDKKTIRRVVVEAHVYSRSELPRDKRLDAFVAALESADQVFNRKAE